MTDSILQLSVKGEPIWVVANQDFEAILSAIAEKLGDRVDINQIKIISKEHLPLSQKEGQKLKREDIANFFNNGLDVHLITDFAERWDWEGNSNKNIRIQIYQLITSTLVKPVFGLQAVIEDILQAREIKTNA